MRLFKLLSHSSHETLSKKKAMCVRLKQYLLDTNASVLLRVYSYGLFLWLRLETSHNKTTQGSWMTTGYI